MAELHITPDPTDDEVAAIVAAIDLATPRVGGPAASGTMPRWRWSGRWWTRPVPVRRTRPW